MDVHRINLPGPSVSPNDGAIVHSDEGVTPREGQSREDEKGADDCGGRDVAPHGAMLGHSAAMFWQAASTWRNRLAVAFTPGKNEREPTSTTAQ